MKQKSKEEIALLEEFFSISDNSDIEYIAGLALRVDKYLTLNDPNKSRHLWHIRLILKMIRLKSPFYKDFDKACSLVEPIFDEYKDKDILDEYDVRILPNILTLQRDYEISLKVSDKIFRDIESFKNCHFYETVVLNTHFNLTSCMLQTKIRYDKVWDDITKPIYFKHAKIVEQMFREKDMKNYVNAMEIRNALANDNIPAALSFLNVCKMNNNKYFYDEMEREVNAHKSVLKFKPKK